MAKKAGLVRTGTVPKPHTADPPQPRGGPNAGPSPRTPSFFFFLLTEAPTGRPSPRCPRGRAEPQGRGHLTRLLLAFQPRRACRLRRWPRPADPLTKRRAATERPGCRQGPAAQEEAAAATPAPRSEGGLPRPRRTPSPKPRPRRRVAGERRECRGEKQPPEPCRKMREAVCLPAGNTTLLCKAAGAAIPSTLTLFLLLPLRPGVAWPGL